MEENIKRRFESLDKNDISIVITALFGILGLYGLSGQDLFPVSIVLIILSVIILVYLFYQRMNQKVFFFNHRSKLPSHLQNKGILKLITENKWNLRIIGRTNISWFKDDFIPLYIKATEKGCKLEFVIQHEFVDNKNLDDVRKQEIKSDYQKVRKFFDNENIKNNENISLRLTKEYIENSMTKIYRNENLNERVEYFMYDISQGTKAEQTKQATEERPVILFKKDSVYQEYRTKFKNIFDDSTTYSDFKNKCKDIEQSIDELNKKYSEHSKQRDNCNSKLIPYYFKQKDAESKKDFFPPVSIQLLVTNTCNTNCIMCNHHTIGLGGQAKKEFSEQELKNVLSNIKSIGTNNIIISGGEPLNRPDIFNILNYAENKKLNIGLLTNGIKKGLASITDDDAKTIKNTCDWIQVSVDSFDKGIYEKIRRADALNVVLESINNLKNNDVNVEVCYTIQQENIEEAIRIANGETPIPFQQKGVPLRFKFVHGFEGNKNDFLPSEKLIEDFYNVIDIDNDNYNGKYLRQMLDDDNEYFNYNNLANGTPLKNKNNIFKDRGYKCHIINYSCKIDEYGNVYPCCFLFDDNQGNNSILRQNTKIESLRPQNGILKADDGKKLKEILSSNRYTYYKHKLIPIENACDYCIRHFYQNEFLNELDKKISALYSDTKFLPNNIGDCNAKIWI